MEKQLKMNKQRRQGNVLLIVESKGKGKRKRAMAKNNVGKVHREGFIIIAETGLDLNKHIQYIHRNQILLPCIHVERAVQKMGKS